MSLSVSNAEAGLLAAPWETAQQDDTALFEAAKNFYGQTADLTQRGSKDHPTDRIVLYDTAATLALELAADGSARPPTLTKTVILPAAATLSRSPSAKAVRPTTRSSTTAAPATTAPPVPTR